MKTTSNSRSTSSSTSKAVMEQRKPRRCQARTVSGLTIDGGPPSLPDFLPPDPQHAVGMREPQSLGPRSVYHAELMAQPRPARSTSSTRTELLVSTAVCDAITKPIRSKRQGALEYRSTQL